LGVIDLPQRFDLEDRLPLDGELPIGHQLVAVDLEPRLNQLHLGGFESSLEDIPFRLADHGTLFSVLDVDMGRLVLVRVEVNIRMMIP
jgi:hypothetical protein